MNQTQAKKEIQALTRAIEEHNHKYYVLNDPVISDEEYDRLLKKLIDLEEAFPQLKSRDISHPEGRRQGAGEFADCKTFLSDAFFG